MGKLRVFGWLIISLSLFGQLAWAAPGNSLPNVLSEMQSPGYWTEKITNPQDLVLDSEKIIEFNGELSKKLPNRVFDLSAYPSNLSKSQLNTYVRDSIYLSKNNYIGGTLLGQEYFAKLKLATNIAGIKDENQALYGFTVRQTALRAFPTDDVVTTIVYDKEKDEFQIGLLQPVEALLVLHKSTDGKWYFIQTYNNRGWVKGEDVAVTKNRETWLGYLYNDKFLVVTGSKLRLGYNPYTPDLSELEFSMGTKLPLWDGEKPPKTVDNQSTLGNYAVKLPVRTADGQLSFKAAIINGNSDVTEKYLPFTRDNLLKQAFKFQGERYGMGGIFKTRDAESYLADVYRSFGLKLAADLHSQSLLIGRTLALSNVSDNQRKILMQTLQPGAILYLPEHVLLYLGNYEGRYYAIQNLASYGDATQRNSDGSLKPLVVNAVVVSDLSLPLKNGKTMFDSIIAAQEIGRTGSVLDTVYNQNVSGFGDIAKHWAKADIEKLAELGIIKGKNLSEFAPQGNITRAEFASMLARALKLPAGKTTSDLKDVSGQWFAAAVESTVKAQIIQGYEDTTFRPGANITRTEMAIMVSRALTYAKAGKKVTNLDKALAKFNDKGLIKKWAQEDVAVTATSGIILGNSEGKFAPTSSTTRAEAATIMKRLMTYLKLIK